MVVRTEDRRLIKIESRGVIRQLRGGLMGPIQTPFYENMSTVKMIVQDGHKVHFVNPTNYKQTVLITLENLRKTNEELFPVEVKEEPESDKKESEKEVPTPVNVNAETPNPQKSQQSQRVQKNQQQQNNKGNNAQVEDTLTQPK